MSTLAYRPDVDGLRAVAVSSVIAFHFSKTALPGGYLGVDMFFVLSGFLITTIIHQDMQAGRFTIAKFYERRVRRIMPALVLILLCSTLVAGAFLLPADLIGYGKSLLATLAFVANIYFWRDANYFSRAAEEKPLLHLWSLGVEEQFYVLFPLLLVVLKRYWPSGLLSCVAVGTVLSFAANVLAIAFDGAVPGFFLLPTRAWELGAGATLALMPAGLVVQRRTAMVIAVVSTGLVAGGLILTANPYASIPVALPVVAGTVLLIWAGRFDNPVSRLLAARPIVFLGLISYSLYLWHWPIIVFVRYYLVRDLTIIECTIAVAAMLACAVLSWRFVERPFRNRDMPIRRVAIASGAATTALAAAGMAAYLTQGLPGRLRNEAAVINSAVGTNYRCPVTNYLVFGSSRACILNLPKRNPAEAEFALFGNSHAQMYAPLIEEIAREKGTRGLLVPMNGCLPTVTVNLTTGCAAAAQLNLKEILDLPALKTVILAMTWRHDDLVQANGQVVSAKPDEALIASLDDLISRIENSGRSAVLIGPIEYPGWDIASVVSREIAFGWPASRRSFETSAMFMQRYGAAIRHFEARLGGKFLRPDKVLCDAERCAFITEGRSLFADSNHLAQAELYRFRQAFDVVLPDPRRPAGGK